MSGSSSCTQGRNAKDSRSSLHNAVADLITSTKGLKDAFGAAKLVFGQSSESAQTISRTVALQQATALFEASGDGFRVALQEFELGGHSKVIVLAGDRLRRVVRDGIARDSVEVVHEAVQQLLYRQDLSSQFKEFEGFPTSGVKFLDMFALTAKMSGCGELLDVMCEEIRARSHTLGEDLADTFIAGLDMRGIMLGFALAARLKLPFLPFRKPGKLP